jgi:hypothetical protein
MRVAAERLARMILRQPDDVITEGYDWYPSAHDETARIAEVLGIPHRSAAGIVAMLSPGVEASENLDIARLVGGCSYDLTKVPAELQRIPKRMLIKALRIRDGEDPDAVFNPRRAPKTTCFYRNICDPHDDTWVTIDGRMADLIVNQRRPWSSHRGIASARLSTGETTLYESYEETVRYAARIVTRKGLPMHGVEAQACLWMAGKRIELAEPTVRGTPRKKGLPRKGERYT